MMDCDMQNMKGTSYSPAPGTMLASSGGESPTLGGFGNWDGLAEAKPELPPRDPLLQLVSLQKASGCWVLDQALAAALGKTSEEVENAQPSGVNKEVWATILALVWLHGFKVDAQEEWELLAMKAVSWLRAQNAQCVLECVEAGNTLLGCKVQKDALGI